jgi:hypothetical protein
LADLGASWTTTARPVHVLAEESPPPSGRR